MVDIAGRIPLERLSSSNAALDDVLTWNGNRWVPAAAAGGDSDHDGAGTNSTAVGTSATAAGFGGTALGDTASAASSNSTALGYGTVGGINSVAVGYDASTLSGDNAVAVGVDAVADHSYCTAVGKEAAATAAQATALGKGASASAASATSLGANSTASGDDSTAVGRGSTAGNLRATAVGYNASTTADDQCLVQADSLEVASSSGGTVGTSVVIVDTVSLVRMRISIASGVLTVAPA